MDLNVVACPGAWQFSQKMVKNLKRRNPRTNLVDAEFVTFKNTEVKCVIKDTVRGSDVFIIQDVANQKTGSINDNLWALYTAIDSCNHASCGEVTVVLPTFPYARQHKKTTREGLTAAMVCHFLEGLGVKRVVTLDIHSREIQNAFQKTIMENLHASYHLVKKMVGDGIRFNDVTVVAPDVGSISRNTFFANALKRPLVMMYKERDYSKPVPNVVSQKLVGEIGQRNAVMLFDDMIDTGGTILKAARFLKEKGVGPIYISCSLPFFNDPALRDFDDANKDGIVERVYGTNAVYNPNLWRKPWFRLADVTELFADVIFRISEKVSLSELLNGADEITELVTEGDQSDALIS